MLAYTRAGHGAPMVLLHALGLSRESWAPVLPQLSERFDVIAVDLPGFGESPLLPDGVEASPAALAASVAALLAELQVRDAHLVGNSLGGWVALELAHLRPAASLTLLSPAGMWKKYTPLYCRASLRATRWAARHAERVLCWAVRFRWGRLLVLGQAHGRPVAVPVADAQNLIRAIGRCPGFQPALRATLHRRYQAGPPLDVVTTLAVGTRDRVLLRRKWRRVDELPAGTQVRRLPRCGHIPMSDDPAAVAALIAATASPAGDVLPGARPAHMQC